MDKGKSYFLVLFSCGGLAASALGLITNVNGIFFKAVSEALGVGRGSVSLAATLTALTTGFLGPASVKTIKAYKLRWVMIISALVTVLSTAALAFVKEIWLFDMLSIVRGGASAFFGIPVVTFLMGNWFVRRRGMLTGVVMSVSGIVGAFMSPVLGFVIERNGYQSAYLICAVLMLLFCLPAMLFLYLDPEEIGLEPYGMDEQGGGQRAEGEKSVYPFRKLSVIYLSLLLTAFLCQSVCSIAQHLAGYAESTGHGSMVGAMMISAAMIGNITAKFGVGTLSDLLGEFKSAFILIGTFLTGMLLLIFCPGQEFMLYIGSCLFGATYACAIMLSNVTFAIYGTGQYGEAYSFLAVILNLGGALAIAAVGYVYDFFQSYNVILWSGLIMILVSLALLIIIQYKMKKTG